MKRKIALELEQYYKSDTKKAFLLKGARQTGKTYAINDFLETHYEKNRIVYINFINNGDLSSLFYDSAKKLSLDPETVLRRMSISSYFKDLDLTLNKEKKIAIFFDEIQDCAEAITSLKFFALKREYFDIYASGSYLGFVYPKGEMFSYPVGYVLEKHLFPMDFEEFLWANGISENRIENIKSSLKDGYILDSVSHDEMIDLFKRYIIVGGLPGAVKKYIETGSFLESRKELISLYSDYQANMNKHLPSASFERAYSDVMRYKNIAVFDSIASQICFENKKFMYRRVSKGGRERMYVDNIEWLKLAMMVIEVDNVKSLTYPLEIFKDESDFKLFYFDTGILLTRFPESIYDEILDSSSPTIGESLLKGGIYENAVACILQKKQEDPSKPLLYYHDSAHEVDFVVDDKRIPTCIEVKSGSNLKSNSMQYLLEKNEGIQYQRVSSKQVSSKETKILDMPFYQFALN